MERLYEIGKRFERLLYTSVLVIIASLLVSSLSNSILQSSAANRIEILQDYANLLKENEKDLLKTKSILEQHRIFKDKEEQRKKENDQKSRTPEEKAKILADNEQRKILGLAINDTSINHSLEKVDDEDYKNSFTYIAAVRKQFNLYAVKDLDDGWNTYREVLRKLADVASGMNSEAYALLNSNIGNNKYPKDLINETNKLIAELKSSRLTILDVETPLNIPLSLGEVKSTISLYTIEKWTMIIMPLFFVIWLGSIAITRRYETYLLLESNRFINAYPHILNIFYLFDKRVSTDSVMKTFYLASLGDKVAINNVNSSATFYFIIRSFILCGVILLITLPAYYGFLNVIFNRAISNGGYYLFLIMFCIMINILQLCSLIEVEYRISAKLKKIKE